MNLLQSTNLGGVLILVFNSVFLILVFYAESNLEGLSNKEKNKNKSMTKRRNSVRIFGFNRSAFGDTVEKRNRKWWYVLSEERHRDIENEKIK
jgi:hypothetical protein